MRGKDQIKILGIVRGWSTLPAEVQQMTNNCEQCPETLDANTEQGHLEQFVKELGLTYQTLCIKDQCLSQAPEPGSPDVTWISRQVAKDDYSYWTRSWNNKFENKATGLFVHVPSSLSNNLTLLIKRRV